MPGKGVLASLAEDWASVAGTLLVLYGSVSLFSGNQFSFVHAGIQWLSRRQTCELARDGARGSALLLAIPNSDFIVLCAILQCSSINAWKLALRNVLGLASWSPSNTQKPEHETTVFDGDDNDATTHIFSFYRQPLYSLVSSRPLLPRGPPQPLLSKACTSEIFRGRIDLAAQAWQQLLIIEPEQQDAIAWVPRAAKARGNDAEAAAAG